MLHSRVMAEMLISHETKFGNKEGEIALDRLLFDFNKTMWMHEEKADRKLTSIYNTTVDQKA